MRKIPVTGYLNSDEIDERARLMEMEASLLPIGRARSTLVEKARQLRSYADMKRLLRASSGAALNRNLRRNQFPSG
jgi:hypothetical protein